MPARPSGPSSSSDVGTGPDEGGPRAQAQIAEDDGGPTVAKLIYTSITSLDGYHEDKDGNFAWATPDTEVFAFITDLERPVGTYLYGRRMYETMVYWQSDDAVVGRPAVVGDFARLWRAASKVVYSSTLGAPSSTSTRIERSFDPPAVRRLKAQATHDLTVGGPDLAGQAIRAGLVDEINLFVTPVVVGGGRRALPDDVVVRLELLDEHRFAGGVVHLRYAPVH